SRRRRVHARRRSTPVTGFNRRRETVCSWRGGEKPSVPDAERCLQRLERAPKTNHCRLLRGTRDDRLVSRHLAGATTTYLPCCTLAQHHGFGDVPPASSNFTGLERRSRRSR